MAPERITVEIFYDVVSPYTWVAFEVLCRYRKYWNMDLKLRPFFLGGIMKESGNRPPMMVPNKGIYMKKDIARIASYFGIPLKFIENPLILVERGSIRAMRFLTAINLNCPEYLEDVSRELWNRIWANGEDIVENESLKLAAKKAKMTDSDIEKCLKLMESTEVKESLKKTTGDAIEHGAFGAPTIVVHTKSGPEMFFGSDRFPLIAAMMNEPWMGPFPDTNSKL